MFELDLSIYSWFFIRGANSNFIYYYFYTRNHFRKKDHPYVVLVTRLCCVDYNVIIIADIGR